MTTTTPLLLEEEENFKQVKYIFLAVVTFFFFQISTGMMINEAKHLDKGRFLVAIDKESGVVAL